MEEKNPNYPCKLEMKMTKAATTKAPKEQLNCPRCKSNNTKFCYYNNYSLNQPRYFCKSCRRYWTEGGSLRNVPIGGASRKNRSKPSSITSTSTTSTSSSSDYFCSNNNKNQKLPNYPSSSQISTQIPAGLRDLNLADHDHLPKVENVNYNNFAFGFRDLSSFIPNLMRNSNNINNNGNLGINSNSQYSSSGFSLGVHVDVFKPSFGINSVDGRNLLLPFQELNQQSAAPNEGDHQNWSEMLGGGSL